MMCDQFCQTIFNSLLAVETRLVLWRRSQFRQFPSFAGMASCSARCAAVSLRLARKLRISRGSVPVPPRTGFLRDCLSPPPEQLRRFLPKSPDRRSPWQSCSHSATSANLANPAVDERSEVGLPIGVFLHLVLLGFEKNCRQLMYPLGRGGLGYLFQQGVSIDRLSGQAVVGEVATERSQNGAKILHCHMPLLVVVTTCKSCNLSLEPDQQIHPIARAVCPSIKAFLRRPLIGPCAA